MIKCIASWILVRLVHVYNLKKEKGAAEDMIK